MCYSKKQLSSTTFRTERTNSVITIVLEANSVNKCYIYMCLSFAGLVITLDYALKFIVVQLKNYILYVFILLNCIQSKEKYILLCITKYCHNM